MSKNYFTIKEFQDLHTPDGFNALMGLIDEIKNDKDEKERFYVKDGNNTRAIKYSSETDTLYLGAPIPESY